MDDFNIYCNKCGSDDIGLHFIHGTPNTKDVVIIFCLKCGNNNRAGIDWDTYCRGCGTVSVKPVCPICKYETLNKEKKNSADNND